MTSWFMINESQTSQKKDSNHPKMKCFLIIDGINVHLKNELGLGSCEWVLWIIQWKSIVKFDEISAKSITNKTKSVMGWNIFLLMGPIRCCDLHFNEKNFQKLVEKSMT